MRQQRTKRIVIRVSVEELAAISVKAKEAGMTASALLRDHVGSVRVHNHANKEAWLRAIASVKNAGIALAKTSAASSGIQAVTMLAYLSGIHRQLDILAKQFEAQ